MPVSRGRTLGFERLEEDLYGFLERYMKKRFTGRLVFYTYGYQVELLLGEPVICIHEEPSGRRVLGKPCLDMLSGARGEDIVEVVELSRDEVLIDLDYALEKEPETIIQVPTTTSKKEVQDVPQSRGNILRNVSEKVSDTLSVKIFDPLTFAGILLGLKTIENTRNPDTREVIERAAWASRGNADALYICRIVGEGKTCRLALYMGEIVAVVLEGKERIMYGKEALRGCLSLEGPDEAAICMARMDGLPAYIRDIMLRG
jgi:hypothetical protein